MKNYNTYSVLFFIRNEKLNNHGKVPVYMRITINGKHVEISTRQWIESARWNNAGAIKGNKPDAETINTTIETYRNKAWKTYLQLEERYQYVTAEMLKQYFNKQVGERKTLSEVFKQHNEKVKELLEKEYAPATLKRYETTLNHVTSFLKFKYNKSDIELIELQYQFITDFEHYLKTEKSCNHNSTLKYIKMFRRVINDAVKNDLIIKDPFGKYSSKFIEVKRGFLTEEELNTLINKIFAIQRLDLVRDIFVFSCFTGLAYVDVQKLTTNDIKKDEEGELWVMTERTKTETESNIPLLPKALEIIEKYKDYPLIEKKGKLLPVISNQKMNAYLKEIATLCGIEKNLTFHLARHTFATYALNKDVPIESVSKMMGHKSIRTTQIYAKVLNKKVSNDMKQFKDKIHEKQSKAD